jgi:hypothetical protein
VQADELGELVAVGPDEHVLPVDPPVRPAIRDPRHQHGGDPATVLDSVGPLVQPVLAGEVDPGVSAAPPGGADAVKRLFIVVIDERVGAQGAQADRVVRRLKGGEAGEGETAPLGPPARRARGAPARS